MRFSLEDVGADARSCDRAYSPSWCGGCTASSSDVWPKCDRETLFSPAVTYLLFPCSRVVLVERELMIGLFLVFDVMELQGNYMEELYGPGEYKLTWILCCYFFCIVRLFYIYQTYIFCNFHEIHFETIGNSLLWKHVPINKIIMRLVKLFM